MSARPDIPQDKMMLVQQHAERIRDKTNIEVFRSMYNKMKLTFGEENIQIKKIDEDYILSELAGAGWTPAVITEATGNHLVTAMNNSCSRYELLIRFPEVTISNSRGRRTTVRDMFIKLFANPNGMLISNFMGVTTTFTRAQFTRGYMHSHLVPQPQGSSTVPIFGYFCLGTGSITQVLSLLGTSYDEVNFGMLCVHIKNFLEWESLEGVPHTKLEDIPAARDEQLPAAPLLSATSAASLAAPLMQKFKALPLSEARSMIDLSADDLSVIVTPKEQLETWAATQMEQNPQDFVLTATTVPAYLAHKDPAGRYVSCVAAGRGRDVIPSNRTVLKFRGEDIKVKIIDNEDNLKRVKYANPKIIEQFCSDLSEELTICAIESADAGHENPGNNIGEIANAGSDAMRQSANT